MTEGTSPARGDFYGIDQEGSGTATLYRLPDGAAGPAPRPVPRHQEHRPVRVGQRGRGARTSEEAFDLPTCRSPAEVHRRGAELPAARQRRRRPRAVGGHLVRAGAHRLRGGVPDRLIRGRRRTRLLGAGSPRKTRRSGLRPEPLFERGVFRGSGAVAVPSGMLRISSARGTAPAFGLGLALVLALVPACSKDKDAADSAAITTTTRPPSFPLTGLPAADNPANMARGAISVKIDNVAAARPQSGIDPADLVYEELAEGGLTRFVVVFQSTDAPEIGPVRSARPSDRRSAPGSTGRSSTRVRRRPFSTWSPTP